MEKSPYQILLRQPFNTITKSWVVNNEEENQTMNIICLNIGMKVALSTYKRETLLKKNGCSLKFSLNLKKLAEWFKREVLYIIELDIKRELFIQEVLLVQVNKLLRDEVKLLYLQWSKEKLE